MKIVGIIVEYNPLHNGHIYHINEVKKQSNADVVICVTSGNYVMRGNFSSIDKFSKTEFALNIGADLVVELPLVYSIGNADIFASGAIGILNMLGVNEIYFGSELNNPKELYRILEIMKSEKYNFVVKKYLDEGNSYKLSNNKALEEFNINPLDSNDSLGLSYIKAAINLNSNIVFKTIKRIESNYNDSIPLSSNIASANAIRNLDNIENFVPSYVNDYFINYGFNDIKNYIDLLSYKILSSTNDELSDIMNINEGIENLIKKTKITSINDFNKLVSKRYTLSRINRAMISILLNIKKFDLPNIPPYIRILGFNNKGRGYLNEIKRNIPLIKKVKEGINPILDIEIQGSRLYSMKSKKDIFKKEFEPIIYKSV